METSRNSRIHPFRETVFRTLEEINRLYRFERVQIMGRDEIILSTSYKSPFVIVAYKVLPTAIPSLQSITNIPAQLPIKRVRGGYRLDFDLQTTTSKYVVEKAELSIPRTNKTYSIEGNSVRISRGDLAEGDSVTLRAWIRYEDGNYDGLVMSPYDNDYKQGMSMTQKVVFPDEAKIFGKFTLPDSMWWFYQDDVQNAVVWWDVILILFFVVIVVLVVYKIFARITRYEPSNDNIKITTI